MADLKSMFGKKNDAPDPAPQPVPAAAPAPADSSVEDAPAAESEAPATAMPVRKGLGFLGKSSQSNAGTANAQTGAATPAPKAQPKLAGLSLGKAQPVKAPAVDSASPAVPEGIISLDDLMDDEGPAAPATPTRRYADEIEATAPTRPVPEDASPQMLKFVETLDSVYGMQFDQDLLGNVIKSIMIELQSNPIYISKDWKKSLVQPDDIRIWIRNMREVMGLNKIVKTEKKAKRASKKTMDSNEMLDDLSSLGFTLGA